MWSRFILHGAKDEWSFEAHAPYLRKAFDGGTKDKSREGLDHAKVWSGAVGSSTSVNDTTTKRAMDSMGECHGTAEAGLPYNRAAGELDCSSAYIRLREPDKSDDKVEGVEVSRHRGEEAMTSPEELNYPKAKHRLEWRARSVTMSQRRIYQLRSKGHRREGTDSSVMAW
ncbi:hypothetical protein B296_00020313 [Ensete ventricosum]|uniref:Uncharacterized protein n=1 Tax=Ensete ventricosum TaxID=4639 RepID=A0A427A1W7_ENSVE|nr:hypothetical protein B296_00020313 [Ensete ventricosum]